MPRPIENSGKSGVITDIPNLRDAVESSQLENKLNSLIEEIRKLNSNLQRQSNLAITPITEEQLLNIARVVMRMGEVVKEEI